ncbi:hypothetical protein FB451DRAFT_1053975, partial [Mycena latifolia]
MVQAFITEVLGWESEEGGVFGHTNAYYGTVEQQGRLTLHVHKLIWVTNSLSPQEIRDRIMGPSSKFRKRLIAYLEGAHRAEYFNGSLQSVIAKRQVEPLGPDEDSDNEIDLKSEYRPPTQTFATPPPKPCKTVICPKDCTRCKKCADWWDKFKLEVDDLLVRSNIHTHFLKGGKKKKTVQDFKIRRERKGCLTKVGICRARFPREVFERTAMTEDRHVNVRHLEPMMNTINPIITYVSRCNSDVTSLLSGTAVKAVVSYVSDYVSKLSLKSFQMFASVCDVFEKNSEQIGGTPGDKVQARHMLRKMVNSMSAKMEIGSPMASMYLLGYPDYYASHKYVPFAWRPYVQFVRNFWIPPSIDDDLEDGRDEEEKVPIARLDGKFVASSGVDDYRYRPVVYTNVTLYEWIQCSKKKKRTLKERLEFEEDLRLAKESTMEDDDDPYADFEDDAEPPNSKDNLKHAADEDDCSDWETDDEDDVIVAKQAKINKARRPLRHAFAPGHDLFLTHSVICDFQNLTRMIPNFIGGALPRSDKGDRAAYCMTMLVLFQPWRSPADLKDAISTWDQAFKAHEFTPRQLQLMKNFNVRYECNDARDDHFAQMKKKMADAKSAGRSMFPANFMTFKDKFADDLNDFDYGSDEEEAENAEDDDCEKGPKTLKLLGEAKVMREIMETSGWLNTCTDYVPSKEADIFMAPYKPRAEWANIVKHQRAELTSNKLANLPAESAIERKKRKIREGITILPHHYFNHKSGVSEQNNTDIISAVVQKFALNTEQIRAFRLVADHAS